ncbi:MAG TPA: BBP7 family outer membrane beta-barrel protein, partial [Pirellulales bacterium]|nr:BBP7 family outer membrane beta-barrel protein [Pirellulales bacterium]
EGRFEAGANFQTVRQNGLIGSSLTNTIVAANTTTLSSLIPTATATNTITGQTLVQYTPTSTTVGSGVSVASTRLNQPLVLQSGAFQATRNYTVFTPVIELRAKLSYQLFRRVSLSAGWTGMYMDGVARSSGMTDFVLPYFTIAEGRNRQGVFINGLNLGVEINR